MNSASSRANLVYDLYQLVNSVLFSLFLLCYFIRLFHLWQTSSKCLAVNIDKWGIPRRAQLIQLEDGILSAEQRDQSMKYASVQSARFPLLFLIRTLGRPRQLLLVGVSDLTGGVHQTGPDLLKRLVHRNCVLPILHKYVLPNSTQGQDKLHYP